MGMVARLALTSSVRPLRPLRPPRTVAAAVRKRLTSAGFPAIFPLCALGKETSTTVLGYDQPAVAARSASPWGEAKAVQQLQVRRLTEEQGDVHTPVPGKSNDW